MEARMRADTIATMTEHTSSQSPAEVVIVGGGVAALEALIALRDLAGDRLRITLAAAAREFVYRPMTVAEPFELGTARRYPLQEIAADFDARLVPAVVAGVDAPARRVMCSTGETLAYDRLIIAPGARTMEAFDGAITFGHPAAGAAMRELLERLKRREVHRVAFVAPTRVGWGLPLYELALMTAATLTASGVSDAELFLVTPEPRPLDVFGDRASGLVARLLRRAGVEFVGSTYADQAGGALHLGIGGPPLAVDAIVSLPLVRGPRLVGVPTEPQLGFIPVDAHGRVVGLDRVYAAGDATDFPVKQGGLATQQADAVAQHIAARHGADVTPEPFRPVLRGMLLTGAEPRFLAAEPDDGAEGRTSAQALWRPAAKIAGRYLAPYLAARDRDAEPAAERPLGFEEVEIAVEASSDQPPAETAGAVSGSRPTGPRSAGAGAP
jgi:sulfide:quinone oxidoreductase